MKMKKWIALAAALALALSLAACDWLNIFVPTTQPQTTLETITETQRTTEPAAEPTTQAPPVILYLPNENADGFVTKAAFTDGTAEDIVALLVQEGALPRGCAPLSFSADEAKLDMNEAFLLAVCSTGTTGEYLLLGCLVNSLLQYYGLESVMVTAQGKVIETGHAIHDQPLRFFENQVAVSE